MVQKEPLLSICIPTYNRANILELCLESIICCDGFGNDVEVVISDNCSTDNTEIICRNYTKKHPNIKYYKTETNIGGDRNFQKVLDLGTGSFLKLSNDYCIYNKGSIKYFLDIIKKHYIEKPAIFFHHESNGKKRNYITTALGSFIAQEATSLAWISNHGYWKDDFQYFENKDRHLQTMFQQMDWTVRSFQNKKTLYCYNNPITIQEDYQIKKSSYNLIHIWTTKFLEQPNELYQNQVISKNDLISIKKNCMYAATWWMFRLTFGDKKGVSFTAENGWNEIKTAFGQYPWYYFIFAKAILFSALSVPYRITRNLCKKVFGLKATRIFFRDLQ